MLLFKESLQIKYAVISSRTLYGRKQCRILLRKPLLFRFGISLTFCSYDFYGKTNLELIYYRVAVHVKYRFFFPSKTLLLLPCEQVLGLKTYNPAKEYEVGGDEV